MSEAVLDRRAPPPPSSKTTAVASGVIGLLAATLDYAWDCSEAHKWLRPDDALIVLWVSAIAPAVHLTWKIFINWLEKHAGEQNE